jgi:predicted transcriptional regulator
MMDHIGLQDKETEHGSRTTTATRERKTKTFFLDSLENGYDSGSNLESSSPLKKKAKKASKTRFDETPRVAEIESFYSPTSPSITPMFKRPRGRPPLSGKKPSIQSVLTPIGSQVVGVPLPSALKPSSAVVPDSSARDKSTERDVAKESHTSTKYPRPPFQAVVNKVVSKLMTSDPMSLNDLSRSLVECPRDMVHAVLEVLQVLGLVTQFKAKEGLRPEYQSGTVVYTFVEFARVPESIPLNEIIDDIAEKLEKQIATQRRMDMIVVSMRLIQ